MILKDVVEFLQSSAKFGEGSLLSFQKDSESDR